MIKTLPPIEMDLDGWLRNVRREGTPKRVFHFEHGVAPEIKDAVDERFGISRGLDPQAPHYREDLDVRLHRFLGHEFFRVFPEGARMNVTSQTGLWAEEHTGRIDSWEDLETYPWPDPNAADLAVYEYYEKNLPQDMRVFQVLDLWECVRDLFGFENFCYKLYEAPDLIKAAFSKVGEFNAAIVRACCDFACFGALYISDDLGYKTSTMLPPATIREYIIPWHRRMAEIARQHDKQVWLHSCGQM